MIRAFYILVVLAVLCGCSRVDVRHVANSDLLTLRVIHKHNTELRVLAMTDKMPQLPRYDLLTSSATETNNTFWVQRAAAYKDSDIANIIIQRQSDAAVTITVEVTDTCMFKFVRFPKRPYGRLALFQGESFVAQGNIVSYFNSPREIIIDGTLMNKNDFKFKEIHYINTTEQGCSTLPRKLGK